MSYYIAGGKYIRVGNKLFSRIIPTITNYLYNGDFSNASSGWDINGSGITIDNGIMSISGAWNEWVTQSSSNMLTPLEASTNYVFSFDVSNITDNGVEFRIMDDTVGTFYTEVSAFLNGSYSWQFSTPQSMSSYGFGLYFQSPYSGDMDNLVLSVSEGGGTSKVTITDDFESYTTGLLPGQGNWTDGRPNLMSVTDVAGDNRVYCDGGGQYSAYRTDTLSDNQYSQVTIDAIGWGYVGVTARCSGTGASYYGFEAYGNEGEFYITYFVNNSESSVTSATGVTVTTGDILRMEIEGTTLRLYKNGSKITSIGSSGDVDISSIVSSNPTLASGGVGITCQYDSTMQIDDFAGGEL